MNDIFNFFLSPNYKKANIILEKNNKEKKNLNRKMIIIIFIVEFLFTLSILLNPLKLLGIEHNYSTFLVFLLLKFISLLFLIIIPSVTTKFILSLYKVEKSFTESLFIFLSGSFFISILLGKFFLIINFLVSYLSLIFFGNILALQIIYIFGFILGILNIILIIWLIISILIFYGNIFKSMGRGIGFLIVNSFVLYMIYILLGKILGNYASLLNIF